MEEKKPIQNNYNRPTAVKITILDILNGEYVQENEQNPNYLLTTNKQKVYRINLFATILSKELQGSITNFLIDDGTGTIVLRAFEESSFLRELNIGETLTVIGRVRVYNEEKYLSPEIIKKVNPLWLKVRALELNLSFPVPEIMIEKKIIEPKIIKESKKKAKLEKEVLVEVNKNNSSTAAIVEEKIKEENIGNEEIEIGEEEIKEEKLLPVQKLVKLIKELDSGNGVLIEEVLEKSSLEETEKFIEKMLQNGDIFQIQPGKVKVL